MTKLAQRQERQCFLLEVSKQPVKPITYSIVKTGLIGLTRYVATYWAEKNVRCNAICPGGVENNQNIINNRTFIKAFHNKNVIYICKFKNTIKEKKCF